MSTAAGKQQAANQASRGRQQVRCSKCRRLLGLVTPSDGGAQVEIRCTRCKKDNIIWV